MSAIKTPERGSTFKVRFFSFFDTRLIKRRFKVSTGVAGPTHGRLIMLAARIRRRSLIRYVGVSIDRLISAPFMGSRYFWVWELFCKWGQAESVLGVVLCPNLPGVFHWVEVLVPCLQAVGLGSTNYWIDGHLVSRLTVIGRTTISTG